MKNIFLFIITILLGTKSIIMGSQKLSTLKKTESETKKKAYTVPTYEQWLKNNENLAYQEYLKKCFLGKQEFEKHLPEGGLRKDIGNIVQAYLCLDFKQWQENNKQLLDYVREGNIKLMQELLGSVDVNTNTQDCTGYIDLMKAAQFRNKEIVKSLLEEGANVNAQDYIGSTALMIAVSKNDKELVELLLEKGANVNTKNQSGDTALMIAQARGYKDIVKILNKNVPAA